MIAGEEPNAGEMDQLIEIQSPPNADSTDQNEYGEPTAEWTAFASNVWAEIKGPKAEDVNDPTKATAIYHVTLWAIDGVTTSHRIVWLNDRGGITLVLQIIHVSRVLTRSDKLTLTCAPVTSYSEASRNNVP